MSKRLRVSMEVISGIYAIVNSTNNNQYIGSSKDIYGRWVQHQNDLKKERHHNPHLQNAWKLYGEDSFNFCILEQTNNDTQTLFEREQYWYDYYKEKNIQLYNVSLVVITSSGPVTLEDLQNGKCKILYEQFVDICNLLQYTNMSLKQISQRVGVCHSEISYIYRKEHFASLTEDMVFQDRALLGENHISSKLTELQAKCIIQQMLNGEYTIDLARQYNISPSAIDDIRHHRAWKHLTQGFVFPYPKAVGRGNNKSILQYNLDGDFIAEYKNAREAERVTGIGYKMISRVCNGKRPHTHGFIFKFKN